MSKIAIIGGGYTGLTAAYRLSQKGHEITLFERSNDLGGLAGGFEIEGTNLEKAYHHIFKTDVDIINLAKELGVEDKLAWRESSVSIYYGGKVYPFKGAMDLLKFKPLVTLYLQKDKNWEKYQKISAYEWMKKWSGKQVTQVIWEPLLKGKFDKYYDKVSMAWLWARIHVRANSREGLESEKLGYFMGGFNEFTKALVNKLKENNVEIVTNANVQGVNSKFKMQNSKITISMKDDNDKFDDLEFDKVIATVPSHVFTKLVKGNSEITEDYINKLDSINYLGAVLVVFTSGQDISPFYWHNINDINKPFLVFINHTKLIEKENYGGKNVYYIGSYVPHDHKYFEISDEELHSIWFSAIKEISG
jgi:protoporphyrinogen oxidase